jgi:hypothetical protein
MLRPSAEKISFPSASRKRASVDWRIFTGDVP